MDELINETDARIVIQDPRTSTPGLGLLAWMKSIYGKNAAKVYLNKKKVNYRFQSEKIGESKLFIVPSTSGAASGFWDINKWKLLVNYLNV